MAVYERTYRSYSGALTAELGRFLVLPRYAYHDVFRSRLFVAFLVGCYLLPLGYAVVIYLPHNLNVLKLFEAQSGDLLSFFRYDAKFFLRFLFWQSILAFLLALIVGPALISSDLRNRGLPLYLARPFSRTEYILGKTAVLIILLSAITWVPGILLFLLQSYLAGAEWLKDNLRVGFGIFIASWMWILILCLISLSLSAYVKWKPAARAALFGVMFGSMALGDMINYWLRTSWGSLIKILDMLHVVWCGLFGVENAVGVPTWAAWLSLLAVCSACIGLLARKVRAYEVVR